MSIIEKLGIKMIEVRSQHNHNDFKWFYELEIKEVRELEQQKNEMLEALILTMQGKEKHDNYIYGKDHYCVKLSKKQTHNIEHGKKSRS